MMIPRIVLTINPTAIKTVNHRSTPLLKVNPDFSRDTLCAVESIANTPERPIPSVCQMPETAKNNNTMF